MREIYLKVFKSAVALVFLLMALPIRAEVQSIVDLYGKYHFTADVEVSDASYSSYWSNDCEVIITKDENGIYDAQIEKLAGASGAESQKVTGISFDTDRIRVTNPNGSNGIFAGGIHMADEEGNYPYGGDYGPIYYNFDRETKEITLPDFTLVTVNHGTQTASVVVKFTNVKMTLIEAETIDVPDISGTWNYKNGSGAYDSMADSPMSPDFVFELTLPDASTPTAYEAKFTFDSFAPVTLPATFDGNKLTVSFDNVYVDVENNIFLGTLYGASKTGQFSFTYVSETSLSLSDGITFYKTEGDDDNYYQYCLNGRATREGAGDDNPKWDGAWTVKANIAYNADGGDYPTEFTMNVTYYEALDAYYVDEFWGNSVSALNYGGILLTPSETNPKEATLATDTYLKSVVAGASYMKLYDMNLSNSPLTLTMNDDGTLTISPFSVATVDFNASPSTPALNVYYDNVTAERVVPSFAGKWKVTATLDYTDEADTYPTEFPMEIVEYPDYDMTLVAAFWDTAVYSLNYGGISLEVNAEDNTVAELPTDKYVKSVKPGELYDKLYDYDGGTGKLSMKLSADGKRIDISDFSLAAVNYNDNSTTVFAKYKNVKAVKVSDEEYTALTAIRTVKAAADNAARIYTLDGKLVSGAKAKGVYVVKRGNKAVKVLVK